MATMALPIRELERSLCDARAETERVVTESRVPRPNMGTVCNVMFRGFVLKWLLARLVSRQDHLINLYREFDFNRCTSEELTEVAASLEQMLNKERDVLTKMDSLGAVRGLWGDSLWKLAEQVEYLDSIADSLRVACDDEASSLLAIAAEQFVA